MAAYEDIVLPPLASKTGPISALYFAQGNCAFLCNAQVDYTFNLKVYSPGADVETSQYVDVLKALQENAQFPLWIGIPQCTLNACAIPGTLKSGIERVAKQMKGMGMEANLSFYGGHSLGKRSRNSLPITLIYLLFVIRWCNDARLRK